MECRLCLFSAPMESSVSLFANPHALVQRIWACCRLRVKIGDRFPDTVCFSCVNNLESFTSFRNVCLQSDKTSKLRLDEHFDVKTEEVLLEDLSWENDSGANSSPNVYNSPVNDVTNERNSSASKRSDFKQNIHSIENFNSPVCGEKWFLENYRTESKDNTKISLKEPNHESKLRLHQNNSPIFKCEFCYKSFTLKFKLVKHMRSHTVEKLYKCDICLKSFAHQSKLFIHKKFHTGEKPYKCDVCLKSFATKCILVGHLRSHTGEKPYKCGICLKSFTQKSNLAGHKRLHTGEKPYKCNICLKSFAKKSNLAGHERSHSGEKPYQCDICCKSFSGKSNLVRHERSHTGEKPHKCDICLKLFAQKSHLITHMKSHAKVNHKNVAFA
ncbi:uncharacterized protein LOC143911650 [Arctopsyche grandis]|uniref:uncharacterized protein LOC143911650 n=1 Tax=Arctopsyche grandis TaxID=121162 RepID=UPI00406D94E4